jgi:hypothetical protein
MEVIYSTLFLILARLGHAKKKVPAAASEFAGT